MKIIIVSSTPNDRFDFMRTTIQEDTFSLSKLKNEPYFDLCRISWGSPRQLVEDILNDDNNVRCVAIIIGHEALR